MRGTTHFPATSDFKICTFWPLIEQWWEEKGIVQLNPLFPLFSKVELPLFQVKNCGTSFSREFGFPAFFQYYLILIALRLHFSVAGVKDRQAPDLGQPFGNDVRVARCII